jgi:hypothetical protein
MNELLGIARLRIHPGKLEEFKRLQALICSAAGELCGSPSPELMKALEGSPVRIFSPYLSM